MVVRLAAAAMATALVLTACNTTGPGIVPALQPFDERASAESGYGRAFGRVSYTGWEEPNLLSSEHVMLYVRAARGGDIESMDLASDGQFMWPLKPGEYVLVGYRAFRSQGYVVGVVARSRNDRVWATFSVPAAGQAVYIGELRITGLAGGRRMYVFDRYDQALDAHDFALKQGKFQPAKGLMRLEQSPEKYGRRTSVCEEAAWGIACNDELRGIEPVLPEGTAGGYPVVRSRSPVLEWKPASRPNTTYDVVIYESYPQTMTSSHLTGARVAYAEGLSEPRFVPPAPLQPGMTYEWSVRLREGDTVSSWSTAASGLALKKTFGPFGFTTPEK